MIIEVQRDDEVRESINLAHAIGITMQDDIENTEITHISVYFPAVFNPATEFANPSIIIGTYSEYDDAIMLYEAIQHLDWAQNMCIEMPRDGENVKEVIESWRKLNLFPFSWRPKEW